MKLNNLPQIIQQIIVRCDLYFQIYLLAFILSSTELQDSDPESANNDSLDPAVSGDFP